MTLHEKLLIESIVSLMFTTIELALQTAKLDLLRRIEDMYEDEQDAEPYRDTRDEGETP